MNSFLSVDEMIEEDDDVSLTDRSESDDDVVIQSSRPAPGANDELSGVCMLNGCLCC